MIKKKTGIIETSVLYDGKITLEYNDDRHIYTVDSKIANGVTSILGVIDKPVLMNWAVKLTKDKVYSEAVRLGGSKFIETLKEVLLKAGREHNVVSKKAREDGTRMHKFGEDWFGEDINRYELIREIMLNENKEVINSVSALLKFFNEHEFEPVSIEGKCYSIENNYAGTVDYYGKIDGKMTVMDLKSSKAIYESYPLQISAYSMAKIEEGLKVEQGMVVRAGKDGVLETMIISRKEIEDLFPAFLGAKSIYDYKKNKK